MLHRVGPYIASRQEKYLSLICTPQHLDSSFIIFPFDKNVGGEPLDINLIYFFMHWTHLRANLLKKELKRVQRAIEQGKLRKYQVKVDRKVKVSKFRMKKSTGRLAFSYRVECILLRLCTSFDFHCFH